MKILSSKALPYEVLLNELIAVNARDGFVSSIDKWKAHSNKYLSLPDSLPHRAFSIFLFNSENKLLLQKRSVQKRTFPLCWTNTCCSHPNMVKMENGEVSEEPIRESLHRALHRELRMDLTNSPFYFMNKILYKQLGSNGKEDFGQYQVDYVYLNKLTSKEIAYAMVEEEVADLKWVSKQELPSFMEQVISNGGYFSPWFQKMTQSGLLLKWWSLIEEGKLQNNEVESNSEVINMKA